jgi:hypothetical protein
MHCSFFILFLQKRAIQPSKTKAHMLQDEFQRTSHCASAAVSLTCSSLLEAPNSFKGTIDDDMDFVSKDHFSPASYALVCQLHMCFEDEKSNFVPKLAVALRVHVLMLVLFAFLLMFDRDFFVS